MHPVHPAAPALCGAGLTVLHTLAHFALLQAVTPAAHLQTRFQLIPCPIARQSHRLRIRLEQLQHQDNRKLVWSHHFSMLSRSRISFSNRADMASVWRA